MSAESSDKASPAEFELFSQYAQATYCAALFDTTVNTAVCTNGKSPVCTNFQGTVTVKEFTNAQFGTIAGYVATNPSKKHIVVAFKGTDPMSLVDVQTDLAKNLVSAQDLFPGQLCVGCNLHNGFKTAFTGLKADLEQTLKTELGKTGQESYRVVVTGHSLGGAVATIAGAYLRTRGIACDIYSYGSPRVGNQEFADLVTKDSNFSARITNGNDFVPAVPYGSLFRLGFYAHTYPEYWYKDGLLGAPKGYETTVTKCNSKEECAGPTCGKAQKIFDFLPAKFTCRVSDHTKYIDPAVLPCKDVRKPKSNDPKDAPITDEEFRKFLEEQEKDGEQKQE
ncbi:hypothetical protein LMH87_001939 [Akanthomyces muscarius]|uniref:Fungal lipase-type domain-containing protein n=1 Tax=Akanthomyces muscarius TaxID=2231603 RepID=A0A9W8Q5V3_AKAMU|nr:hypothetical protein LMH87_001939 [Akanthomyces muscarius]KAJ4147418.1 hypothetical protein LMH87_001939 [Akanthomyces muscarius]